VLIFLAMIIRGVPFLSPTSQDVLGWGADYGPLTLNGQWWRMFASMFLHFGIIHLVFNMLVLANIGIFMESLSAAFPIWSCISWPGSAETRQVSSGIPRRLVQVRAAPSLVCMEDY